MSRRSSLKVRSGLAAGGLTYQHNRRVMKVRSGVRAGGIETNNHSRNLLIAR